MSRFHLILIHKLKATQNCLSVPIYLKAMSKLTCMDVSKSLLSLEPRNIVERIKCDVGECLGGGNLCQFVEKLFENVEPMFEIARHHLYSFVLLYGKCKTLRNLSMEFQRHWHVHCSTFLLEEKYTG